ncbi:MAG: PD-(D/E)XK nuclease family protein [Coriobacteriales bacterium]
MSISRTDCISTAQLRSALGQLAAQAVERCGAVDVLVGSPAKADELKLALMGAAPLGVRVVALQHWLREQWDLWGDGTQLVSPRQRHVLLRPLLRQAAGMEPSSAYVDAFCSFVQDALAVGAAPSEELLSQALDGYRLLLTERGLQEAALIQQQLAQALAGRALIFVEPQESHACTRLLIERLGAHAQVGVLQRQLPCNAGAERAAQWCGGGELGLLRQRLFTGKGGLTPAGAFAAAEVQGIHAEPAAVLQLVQRWLGAGVRPEQIAVLMPRASQAYPGIVQCLADAGIPVECRYQLPLGQTGFGAAFLQLERLLGAEDDGFENSAAFIASPYSGLSAADARGFAAVWRSQAGSTHGRRLDDLSCGLKGRVGSKVWSAKLDRLRALLAAPGPAERVRLMYQNACETCAEAARLEDDAAAASSLLSYLELCEQLGQTPCLADLAELSVNLVCAAGEGPALRIAGAGQLGSVKGAQYLVFARLDKDSYPMASAPGPFDGYLEHMGAPVEQATALCNRALLLDALEAADGGFACYRLATTEEGDPSCQSALWDELMSAYRLSGQEELAPHELSPSLVAQGCGLSICEGELFAREAAPVFSRRAVRRGELNPEALELVFPDELNFSETFSPTAIEDYYRCPYRWLICRRIGAGSPDKPFDQIAMGNLAHAVLERVYLIMQERGLPRVTPETLELCLQIADEAFDYQRQHEIDRHRLNLMTQRDWEESELVRRQVKALVERDASFLPGFKPTYLELKLENEDGSPLRYAGVPVRGKVDRIDVDGQGRAVIIDYKLSGLDSGYGLSGEGLPTRIQTDIYASLVQRCLQAQGVQVQVVGSVYRSYAKNMLRGVYQEGIDWGPQEQLRQDKDAVPGGCLMQSYTEYLEAVECKVEELMARMAQGDLEPRPLCSDACEYCLAESFCPQRRS